MFGIIMRGGRRRRSGGGDGDKGGGSAGNPILLAIVLVPIFLGGFSVLAYMAYQDSRWVTENKSVVRIELLEKRHHHHRGHGHHYLKFKYNGVIDEIHVSPDFYEKYESGKEAPLCLIKQARDGERRELLRESCDE